jgi:hypothetical protein
MSVNFSWGSNKDHNGRVIDANATEVSLPESATDADVAQVAQLCKQLQDLYLGGCQQITDAGLQHIASLKQLQNLTCPSGAPSRSPTPVWRTSPACISCTGWTSANATRSPTPGYSASPA